MEKGLVSIDRWGDGSQAYFLTHLHADHTNGLSSRWARGTLFCSPISAKLLPSKFPGFDLSLIRVLELGITEPVLLRSPSSGLEIRLLVTPIDAHHCPGAVMYLFRGEFGCALHTGDFRWEIRDERAVMAKKTLVDALEGNNIDVLYLDNTYCHPSFSFPSREVAAQQVIDIINSNPDHEVIIGIDTLGKEDLLLHISRALAMKIWVWPERLKTMHLLGLHHHFTTDTTLTRLRAVPRHSLTRSTLSALNTFHPTTGIMPSGLPPRSNLSDGQNGTIPAGNLHPHAHSVHYSDHSSFTEIQEFIHFLRPSEVTGLVSSSTHCINPRYHFSHLYGNDRVQDDVSCEALRNNKQIRRFESVQSGDRLLVWKRSLKWKKMRAETSRKAVSKLSNQKGRVGVMRRGKFGAKIAEGEESDDLML